MADPIAVWRLKSNPFCMGEHFSLLTGKSESAPDNKMEDKMANEELEEEKRDEERILFVKEAESAESEEKKDEEVEGKEDAEEEEEEMAAMEEEEEEPKEVEETKSAKSIEACQNKQHVHFEPPSDTKLNKPNSFDDLLQQLGTQRNSGLGAYPCFHPANGMHPFGFGYGGCMGPFPGMGPFCGCPEPCNCNCLGPFMNSVPPGMVPGQETGSPGGYIPSSVFRPSGPEPTSPGVPLYPPPNAMSYTAIPQALPGYPIGFVPSPFNLLGWIASPWIPNPLSSLFNYGMPYNVPTTMPNSATSQTGAPCKLCGQCFPSDSTDFSKLRRADGAFPVSVQEEEIKTKRKNYKEKRIPSPDGRTISSRELVNEEEVVTNRRDIFYESDHLPDLGERTTKFSPSGDFPPRVDSKSNYPSTRTSPTESPNPDHELDDDTSEDAAEKDVQGDSTSRCSQNTKRSKKYSNSVVSEDDRDYIDALDEPTDDLPRLQSSTLEASQSLEEANSNIRTSQAVTETTTTRSVRNPSYIRPQMSGVPPSSLQMYGYGQPGSPVQVCTSDPMVFQPVDPQQLTATHADVTGTTTTASTRIPRTCTSVVPPSPESVISIDSLGEGADPWPSDSLSRSTLHQSHSTLGQGGAMPTEPDFYILQAEQQADMPARPDEPMMVEIINGQAKPSLFGPFPMPLLDDASDALMVRNTDKDFMVDLRPTLESGDAVAGDCLEEVADRLPAAGEPRRTPVPAGPGIITSSVNAIPMSDLWTPTTYPCSKIHLLEVVSDPCDDIKRNQYCSTS